MSDNNEEKVTRKMAEEYLDDLTDAIRQRSTPEQLQRCVNSANCIHEIYDVLRKNKIRDADEVIHTLMSVLLIPIQMLETDPKERENLIKQITGKILQEIIMTQIRDTTLPLTEQGRELDKLRQMMNQADVFGVKKFFNKNNK